MEHEKLAVAQRQAAESSNVSADVEDNGGGGNGSVGDSIASGSVSTTAGAGGNGTGSSGGVGEVSDMSEGGEATMVRNMKRSTPTPVQSPAPAYPVPSVYSCHYYETPPKRLMR